VPGKITQLKRVPKDLKQVWFAGVHSNVGGSYPEAEAGLANITLRWMLKEAEAAGLKLVPGQKWALSGGGAYHARARSTAMLHKSLHGFLWSMAEFWPKVVKRLVSAPCVKPAVYKGFVRANLFRRRVVPEGATIHQSVLKRKWALAEYTAPNLPASYVTAPDHETDSEEIRLNVGDTVEFGIFALLRWNDTALKMLKGESYTLTVDGKWYDATIKSDANGYTSNLLKHRLTARFRRSPKQNWFLLMGALSMDDRKAFALGAGTDDLHGHRGWEAVLLRKRLVAVLLQQQWSGEARGEAVELMLRLLLPSQRPAAALMTTGVQEVLL
jgi:Uncharacterized alpha/beta hydrolase domain (DUF2235)